MFVNYEYPPIGGGAATATQEIARAMLKLGHQITVVTSRTPSLKGYIVEESVHIHRLRGLRIRKDRSNLLEMFIFLCSAYTSVVRIAKRNTIDATICFFSMPVGPIGLLLQQRLGVPYLVSLRGGDVPGLVPELALVHQALTFFRRKILRNATAVIANSSDLARHSRVSDPCPVVVIPNGVDTEYFSPSENGYGKIDGNPIRILFVGRFHRQKDVPGLIRNLALVRKDHRLAFTLTLVGDGPERAETKRVVVQNGLDDVTEWKGWLGKEDLKNSYQQADCLINLSSYEGLPNTVLEAMSCGLTVIASDIGPHRELIEDGATGFLAPKDKPEIIALRLFELSNDRHMLQDIGERARQKVTNNYDWADIAKRYIAQF